MNHFNTLHLYPKQKTAYPLEDKKPLIVSCSTPILIGRVQSYWCYINSQPDFFAWSLVKEKEKGLLGHGVRGQKGQVMVG